MKGLFLTGLSRLIYLYIQKKNNTALLHLEKQLIYSDEFQDCVSSVKVKVKVKRQVKVM